MTRRLLELGHPVTGVDIDDSMLRHAPRQASLVEADIESLVLNQTFPVVLLASNLINAPDDVKRKRLLSACARHVAGDGVVILQRYDPGLGDWQVRDWVQRGPIEVRVADCHRQGDTFGITVQYRFGERHWSHSFSALLLDDSALAAESRECGLAWGGVLKDDPHWVQVVPDVDGEG